MTAFTVNSGGIVNWDSLSGGSVNATLDSYAVSAGSTLLIDTDSYLCANHSAAFGSLDTVTYSGIGGTVKIDGTNVWVIPYNTGSGNVPAIGTTISQGGVSGYFLGAWASWLVEPTASGSAMPASGFIKIRALTGGAFAAGAITGIGATATGPSVRGWIEVRGADTATITVPRIGKFEVTGDWFELGTTNGARGQILACPTCATTAGTLPGVWIETAAGSGVYERYTGVGSMVNLATNPTDERGKMVWHTATGFRIGSDGTNNVGYLPPTGCKVRVPNVFLHCCTRTVSGSGPRVAPSTTNTIAASTRQEFVTTNAGDISIQNAVSLWSSYWSQAYKVVLKNSAFNDYIQILECASPLDIDNIIVSPNLTAIVYPPLTLTSNFAGGTVQNSLFARFSMAASGAYANLLTDVAGITFSNIKTQTLLNRGNASTGAWNITRAQNCNWNNSYDVGGRKLLTSCQNVAINSTKYADSFSGTTGTTNGHSVVEVTSASSNVTVDGIDFNGITNVHPYVALVTLTASYNILVKNIGTYASKLSLGSANQTGVIASSGGNNAGVKVKRAYAANTRSGVQSFVNSDTGVIFEHVYGDYADTDAFAILNATIKNCGITSSTSGQTSVYGLHWLTKFTSTTAGALDIVCNEPTALSAAQCAITSGAPKFNSVGQLLATSVGQAVTWETDWMVIGYTAFTNSNATVTGTNATFSSGSTWGNHTIEYQIDTGSGYSAWKNFNGATLSAETISPSTGFKIKVRVTCLTANASNAITKISIPMTTTDAAQGNNLYPLSVNTVTITGLVSGSRIIAKKVSGGTVLANMTETGGVATFQTDYTGAVAIEARKASGAPNYIPWPTQITTVSGGTVTATALQQLDE